MVINNERWIWKESVVVTLSRHELRNSYRIIRAFINHLMHSSSVPNSLFNNENYHNIRLVCGWSHFNYCQKDVGCRGILAYSGRRHYNKGRLIFYLFENSLVDIPLLRDVGKGGKAISWMIWFKFIRTWMKWPDVE